MSDLLLSVSGLKTEIGSAQNPARVVDGVDFKLHRGETRVLLGESGCGKSMTALSLMRLLPPVARIVDGEVVLDGTDLLALSEVDMRAVRGAQMTMIFQEPQSSLNPVLTIGKQIDEVLIRRPNLDKPGRLARAVDLLDQVGIPDPSRRVNEYPHQLSGGMKQRVMIAMALAGEPDLLIADEPTTALDVTIQAQVLDLLRDLQQRTGMGILLITHDLGVVAQMADSVGVMYAGHIVESAGADAFFRAPAHPYSRKLFDSVPTPGKRGGELAVIPGIVPPLTTRFCACRFASRCEHKWDLCEAQPPELISIGPEHLARCHLHADAGADRSSGLDKSASAHDAPQQVSEPLLETKNSLLEVENLKVHFPITRGVFRRQVGSVYAVDDVSVSLAPGKTLALVGESGCGKTTAGKGILQLIEPTAGQVVFNGEQLGTLDTETLRARRSDIQFIFQDPFSSMNPRMTILDIVSEGMLAQGIGGDRSERESTVSRLLEEVGIDPDNRYRYPHEFSGGQRQRICIARALAVEPKLIICDEPTSALDVSVQAQILNLLRRLQRERDLAYLFITHNLAVVEYLADEVAVMYLGRIVERGTTKEIFDSPSHPYTQALLSAVPTMDRAGQREVLRLEGDLPSPASPPAGCHFHPRCHLATAQCKAQYPDAVNLSDTHQAHCVLLDERAVAESVG